MKKLFVSAGLIAAGAAGISSAMGQALDVISPKAWSVSGTLRGFYDDNYNIAGNRKGSAGFEVSPSISYNLPLQQSDMGIRYTYGMYYYQDRQDLGLNPIDQSHQLDLWLDHAINERWHLNFTDTFVSGQEPELLGNGGVQYRVEGNNIANHAHISLDTQWTRLFGTSLHYGNDFYDYDNSGASVTNAYAFDTLVGAFRPQNTPGFRGGPNSGGGNPNGYLGQFANSGASLAGLLNRVEQNIGLDLNWTFSPTTKVFAGYTFGLVNYTGNEPIAIFNYNTTTGTPVNKGLVYQSNSRDSMSHNVYVGLDYTLLSNLTFQGTVGAEYTDSYNDPLNNTTSVSPTANASLTYTYTQGSYVQLGVSQAENSTDVTALGSDGSLTQYQYTTSVFADVNHHITEKLVGTLLGRYGYSTYEGGSFSSSADDEFNLGVNLSYQISKHFSTELGYNYDHLISDVPGRGFERNRVYIGMGVNY